MDKTGCRVRRALVVSSNIQSKIPANVSKSKSSHPVDLFLSQKIEKQPFQFSKQADKITLLRRLYFDLVGMPPTPEEAESF